MVRRLSLWVLVVLWLSYPSLLRCQQPLVSIGGGLGAPAKTITVPVNVSVQMPVTALSVRLRFDPSVLTFTGISRGSLLTPSHSLFHATPPGAPGLLNAIVYAQTGTPPFTSLSGTAFELTFAVSPDKEVPGGVTEIAFETGASARLPASDLSDPTGASVPHAQANGRVIYITTVKNWKLYE